MRYCGIPDEFLNPHYPGNEKKMKNYSWEECQQTIEFYEQLALLIKTGYCIYQLNEKVAIVAEDGTQFFGDTLEIALMAVNSGDDI